MSPMFSLKDLFLHAGFVAWPLGLFSIIAVAVILERLFVLSQLKATENEAFLRLMGAFQSGAGYQRGPSGGAAPVEAVMDTLTTLRGASEEALQQAAEIAISMQRVRLRRYLTLLATIGSTAPFVGLFGTVLGVMASFQAMSKAGLSGETMANGISEALSATALGLLVAIPSVMAYNFFTGRVQTMTLEIHGHVSRLIPFLSPKTMIVPQEVQDARRP
ncbi:MAG TPA: MotA/TolQ/ExbB proton channel family protein [Chthonomonadaceae bacterium]|nr:MotA/TolQ/ExbB proton channel family protein [Chthonomonadaceae bacterium]